VTAERRHLEETISTLKFATRVMNVSNEASINVQEDPRVRAAALPWPPPLSLPRTQQCNGTPALGSAAVDSSVLFA